MTGDLDADPVDDDQPRHPTGVSAQRDLRAEPAAESDPTTSTSSSPAARAYGTYSSASAATVVSDSGRGVPSQPGESP